MAEFYRCVLLALSVNSEDRDDFLFAKLIAASHVMEHTDSLVRHLDVILAYLQDFYLQN